MQRGPGGGELINLVLNGDFEDDLAGWSDVGTVTRTRSNEQAHSGSWSQKMVTSAAAFSGGFVNGLSWTEDDPLTASFWLYGAAGDTVRISLYDGTVFAGTGDIGVTLATTGWNYLEIEGVAPSTLATGALYIDTGANAQSVTWYVDDVRVVVG